MTETAQTTTETPATDCPDTCQECHQDAHGPNVQCSQAAPVTIESPDAAAAVETHGDRQIPGMAMRDFVIKVPEMVPDGIVRLALSIGQTVTDAISNGAMVLMFPQMVKDEKGNARRVVGHCVVPIQTQSDVLRMLKLAEATGKANEAVQDAMERGKPGEGIIAAANAETLKDNVARNETAKANGQAGGIFIL